MKQNIYLIGFMGTGKSTVSHKLARLLGYEELDTDAWIVQRQGRSIAEIFEAQGEAAFRDMETALLEELAEGERKIISCGGGMAIREENADLMRKNGIVVLLTAEPETIFDRVKKDNGRPVLNGNMNVEYIRSLLAQRKPYYRAAGEMEIATDGRSPEEIAEKIVKEMKNFKMIEKIF
ncbi:shikimate kinase [Lachnospiraceae bacterium 45-W7]